MAAWGNAMVRAVWLVMCALLMGGIAHGEERTMHFDNLVVKYDFPSRFEYAGRDESTVYFSDGEATMEFAWRVLGEFPADAGATLLDEIETYPEFGRIDGYFRDDLDFEITKKEKFARSAYVRWIDRKNGYTRLGYAMTSCCGRFIVFTIEAPIGSDQDWLRDFYTLFNKGDIAQYDASDDLIRGVYRLKLPRTATPPTGEAQRLYDACSYSWNKHLHGGRPDAKAMVAYLADGKAWCRQTWGRKSEAAAWAEVKKACDDKGAPNCYRFSLGHVLSDWARDQQSSIQSGERDRAYRRNQATVAARQQDQQTYSDGDDGGSTILDDFLGAVPDIIEGVAAGVALGGALSGNNSGSSGSGSSSACSPMRAHADQCYRNWQNIGGGTVSGTQAGSFYECYRLYDANARRLGC